jgi:hypothetical protein
MLHMTAVQTYQSRCLSDSSTRIQFIPSFIYLTNIYLLHVCTKPNIVLRNGEKNQIQSAFLSYSLLGVGKDN